MHREELDCIELELVGNSCEEQESGMKPRAWLLSSGDDLWYLERVN